MTKVIILGANQGLSVEPKKIEFRYYLIAEENHQSGRLGAAVTEVDNSVSVPSEFNYIELICLDYCSGLDLMFAYEEPEYRTNGLLFLGKFNDGVV